MGSSGTPPDATLQNAVGVFDGPEGPCAPRSTGEVADELDCDADAAAEALGAMVDRGDLRSRVVDGETRVWWRPAESAAANDYDEAVEFRAFVNAVRDYAIFTLEPDGTVASWNEGAGRIKGYDREEIVGEHFAAFYTDEDVAEGVPEANLQRAARAGRAEDEGWRVRADGTAFWANVTITAIRDDDGDLQGFTKVTRDMTERRQYEQTLRRERDQTEQVLRTTPVAIAVHGADGETLVANRQARETLGLQEGERDTLPTDREGWTVTDADGEPVPADGSPATRVLDSGEPAFDEELVVEPPDDEPVRLRLNAAPVTDAEGDIDRVVTVAEDVTDLRRREHQLEERKNELETELSEVLGRISDAFYALDDEWRFTHLNDRAVEILGREREALLGREIWAAFPDGDDVYREHFERAMDTQEPEHFEVHEDGADAWLEFTAYPSESGLSIYFRDVSERKARELELERYETLFTESTDVNAVLNPDGTFQYLPPSVEKILGYDQDELVGRDTFELVHPEDRERIADEFAQLVEDPDYQPVNEFRFRHADGHWVWLEAVGRNLIDDPSIEGIVAYTRDVTERREREQELVRTDRRFQAVFEDPNILVGLLDTDGTVLDINETAMEYVEADLAAVVDEPFWETPWWGTEDGIREDVREWTERAAAGEYVEFDADLTRPDGEPYTLEGVFRPVTNEDGDVVSVIVSDRDVTERRERERQLSRLMDNVPGMVYRCQNESGWPMSFVSDACEGVTGYDAEAVECDEISWGEDVIVPEDREMVWEAVQEGFAEGETFSVTYRIETADGEQRWVRDSGRGVVEDGEVVEIEGIIVDVTERKRLEQELQESERRHRTLAEYFPNGIVTLFDEDLTYELAAGQGFADIPVSADDLEGAHVSEAWDEESAAKLVPLFEGALAGEERSIELEYEGRNWIVRAVPITDECGEVFAGMTMAQDITEQKERERALEESERRYRTLAENFPNGAVGVYDHDLRYTLAAGAKLGSGLPTGEELEGSRMPEIFPDHVHADLEPLLRAAVEDGVTDSTTTEFDGRDWRVWAAPLVDEDGEIFGGLSLAQDVTEEMERRTTLERYEAIVETVDDGIYVKDDEGTFTMVNEAYADLTGYDEDELVGAHASLVVDEGAIDESGTMEAAADDGPNPTLEAPIQRADGETVPAEATFGAFETADREPRQVGVVRDVSDRMAREDRLQRYETIVETVNDGVYVVDTDGQFTMVNQAYADMLECDPEELVGEDVTSVVDESVHETARNLEREMAAETKPDEQPTLEADLLTASGDRVPTEANFSLLPAGEDAWHRVGVVRDVSERKARERALEESERRYRTLAENFPDGAVGLFDENLEYTAVGGQMLDEVGVDEDDRVGNSVYDIYPDDLVSDVEPYFQGALRGEANTFEVEFHGRHLTAHILPIGDDEVTAGMLVVQDVTERREARRELRESEAKFRMLAENVDEVVWMADAEAETFHYVNPTFEDIWGFDRERLYDDALTFLDAVHPDDRERVRAGFSALPAEPFDDEFRIVRPDGAVRWVHARGQQVTTADGEMVRVVGVGDDVTDRVERERELERALDLLEKTERVADVGGWEIDVDSQDVYWTDSIFDLLDVADDEEPPLEDALSMYHEADQAVVQERIDSAIEDGDSFDVEARVETRAGEVRWLRLQGVPEFEDGEVVTIRGAAQNVTDRKERERTLQRRAHQQAVVADLGQYALEAEDLDDLMHEASRQVADVLDNDYCKVLDFDPDAGELLLRQGVGWRDGIVGQATVDATENSQAGYTLRSEEPVVVDDLDGESRFSGPELLTSHDVESGVSTIIGSVEEPWGVLGTHDTDRREFAEEDVNFVKAVANVLAEAIERHRYQDELEGLVADLEESNERLEQFAYAASHDLQEPLRMVSSYLQLVERRYGDELDEDGREFLEFAVDGADRMRDMIDGLLAYSRVDTRGDPFEPVDLGDVLADARDDLQVKIDEHDAEITVDELPVVEGDPGQLRQVFQNLLDNAIDYSGDEPPRVHVAADRVGDRWEIAVSDEGVGVDPADADRIFEVFQTLHAREEQGGTGIGLALCQRVVERHGGEIGLDSEPGDGATFTFTLPAAGETDE